MLRAALTSRSWVAPQGQRPLPHVQRHPVADGPARRTHLRRREPAVDHDQVAAVPLALVLHHGPQLPPARVGDGAGQAVVAEHVADLQVLDHDRLVLADESSRELVQVVTAAVGDPGVHPGHPPAGLLPVRRPALRAGVRALRPREPDAVGPLVARVGDLLPGGQGDQGGDARVDPDHGIGGRAVLDGDLAQQRHVPAARAVAGHGHGRGLGPVRQWARPADVERLGHLRQRQRAVPVAERRARVFGRRPRSPLGLERRVLRPLLPEVRERALQVPQCLLQRHAGHLAEVGPFGVALPRGQHRRRLDVGHAALLGVPRLGASFQRQVVNLPHAPERPVQLLGLLIGRIEAVLERPLHHPPRHSSHGSSSPCDAPGYPTERAASSRRERRGIRR